MEADKSAEKEAAKSTAEEADRGSSGHTDGSEAAGAPGASPTAEPPAGGATTSTTLPQSRYIKAGEGVYISLPWAAGSRAPTEGDVIDEDVLTAAGLKLVDEPSSSSASEEEQLLQRLLALYRARREKLASREALVARAESDIQKRVEELQGFHREALQALAADQAKLAEERNALITMRSDIEHQQELAAQKLSAKEGELNQRKVDLDSHEEDLAKREKEVDDKLRAKEEEVAQRVTQRTQEQEQQHKDALDALAKEYAGKLKEATDAAATAEAARKEMEEKATKLEVDLKASNDQLSTFKSEREKVTYDLSEMQVAVAEKDKELTAAKESIEDLSLKVKTLAENLESAKRREEALAKLLQEEKKQLKEATDHQKTFRDNVLVFTDKLAEAAQNIDKELTAMGVRDFSYPTEGDEYTSSKVVRFFEGAVNALKQLQVDQRAQLADEERRLCQEVVKKLLMKIAHRNPGVDFSKVFKSLPKDLDTSELEALVAPIVDRVGQIKRVEGEYRD